VLAEKLLGFIGHLQDLKSEGLPRGDFRSTPTKLFIRKQCGAREMLSHYQLGSTLEQGHEAMLYLTHKELKAGGKLLSLTSHMCIVHCEESTSFPTSSLEEKLSMRVMSLIIVTSKNAQTLL
jgi:hypothetical protein